MTKKNSTGRIMFFTPCIINLRGVTKFWHILSNAFEHLKTKRVINNSKCATEFGNFVPCGFNKTVNWLLLAACDLRLVYIALKTPDRQYWKYKYICNIHTQLYKFTKTLWLLVHCGLVTPYDDKSGSVIVFCLTVYPCQKQRKQHSSISLAFSEENTKVINA